MYVHSASVISLPVVPFTEALESVIQAMRAAAKEIDSRGEDLGTLELVSTEV